MTQRRNTRYKLTPQLIADLKSTMKRAEIAKRHGMPVATVSKYRAKLGVTRPLFRIDDRIDALMKSSLDAEHVARALRMKPATIKQYRVMYRYRQPQHRSVITDDMKQRVIKIGDAMIAARALGIGQTAARAILRKHGMTQRYTLGTPWPTDPAWYAVRTVAEIADAMNVRRFTARRHLRTYKLAYKPMRMGPAPKGKTTR